MKNPNKRKINPKSLENLKPPFQKNNNVSVGYGRPRIPADERAVKEINFQMLNAMVKSGIYRDILLDVIEIQTKQGKCDCIRWMFENAIGSTILAPTASMLMDEIGLS
jgi:hypothetical protein